MRPCTLLSLATAVPPHVISQDEAKAVGRRAFAGKKALFDRLASVFDNAAIDRRHLVAPIGWYEQPHGWSERNAVYLEAGDFCCHPGGAKVTDAIETSLQLPSGELDLERAVLRDFGNMSAPTVLFVLERLIERGLPERIMMTAFGPGFTCAGLMLETP